MSRTVEVEKTRPAQDLIRQKEGGKDHEDQKTSKIPQEEMILIIKAKSGDRKALSIYMKFIAQEFFVTSYQELGDFRKLKI